MDKLTSFLAYFSLFKPFFGCPFSNRRAKVKVISYDSLLHFLNLAPTRLLEIVCGVKWILRASLWKFSGMNHNCRNFSVKLL